MNSVKIAKHGMTAEMQLVCEASTAAAAARQQALTDNKRIRQERKAKARGLCLPSSPADQTGFLLTLSYSTAWHELLVLGGHPAS